MMRLWERDARLRESGRPALVGYGEAMRRTWGGGLWGSIRGALGELWVNYWDVMWGYGEAM